MSADLLRTAAREMREKAEAATPGPWRDSSTVDGSRFGALVADQPHPDRGGWGWTESYGGCLIGESLMAGDRAHIAAWDPTVALAVADSVDLAADWTEQHPGSWPPWCKGAIAVARAFLREAS